MSMDDADDRLFRALGDSRRRRILDHLKERPRTTGELCALFAGILDRCTVMQHLEVLTRAELVVAVRQGRQRWNHLNVGPLLDVQQRWIGPYASTALDLLGRLRGDLESLVDQRAASRGET